MRRLVLSAVLLAVATWPVAAQAQSRTVRTINEDFDPSGHEAIVLDVPVGEVRVEGADVDTITAEVRVRCDRHTNRERCAERAEDIALDSRERRGKLILKLEGIGMWRSRGMHVVVELTVPADMPFELEMGVGEVELANLGSDVTVDMGIGEITVTMLQAAVGSVTLDNGIGETALQHRGGKRTREGLMAGTDIRWNDGPGDHKVEVDLNIGEILVRLR